MIYKIQGLGWFLRRTEDPIALGEFYQGALGLPCLRSWNQDGHVGFMMWAGEVCVMEINQIKKPLLKPADTQSIPIFKTSNLAAARDQLQAADSVYISEEHDERAETYFYRDPAGFPFGIEFVHNDRLFASDRNTQKTLGKICIDGHIEKLSRVIHFADQATEDAAFLNENLRLESLGILNGNIVLGLGQTALLEVRPSYVKCKRPTDREEVGDTWILREYSHTKMLTGMRKANQDAITSLEFPGGDLDYFVTPSNRLFGFQQRRPYDPNVKPTQAIEDLVAWTRWNYAATK